MSSESEPRVEESQSPIFRTVATDYFQYWVEPETAHLLFYTQHFVPKEKRPFKAISKDVVFRELQVECWMATSMAINLGFGILEAAKIRVECPICKTLVSDMITRHVQTHQVVQKT